MGETFHKYERRGPYHWGFVSNHPLRHHCPTTARYKAVLNSGPQWRDADVVDVGCGDGAFGGLLVKAGANVTGVEPEDDGRALAEQEFLRRNLSGRFLSGCDQLASDSFDVAVCVDVIEHVAEPKKLLHDVFRVLKPGGQAIITTPVRLTEIPIDAHHVKEYFPSQFRQLTAEVFSNVKVTLHVPMPGLMFYYWRPWLFFRRPLITYLCNLMEILFDSNPVEGISALDRYHQLQVAVGCKPGPTA